MKTIVHQIAPTSRLRSLRYYVGVCGYAGDMETGQQTFRFGRKPRGVSRFTNDIAAKVSAQESEEGVYCPCVKKEAWGQLHQERAELCAKMGALAQEVPQVSLRAYQPPYMGNRFRYFYREAKLLRNRIRPPLVCRGFVGAVE